MSKVLEVVGKTKGGKEIGYRMPEGANLYEIVFTSGQFVAGVHEAESRECALQLARALLGRLSDESIRVVK